jgi:predicted amidophosphoribosyltransferase
MGFAVTQYSEQPARIINAVKESGITSLVPYMAKLMVANWPTYIEQPLLVPVPSSPSNTRKRGFSHTLLLAKAIAKNMPYTKVRPLLISTRARTDQVGLSANQRQQNLSGAFAVDRRGFQSSGRALVVIDDVSTTGATLASAMASLAEAGLEVAGFGVFAKSGG